MDFVHLHFHTSYSFLDGYNPIKKAVSRIKELGMSACAITDHNSLAGIPEFQTECINNNIKPILGLEGYYTWDIKECSKTLEERQADALNRAIEAGVLPDNYLETKHKKKDYLETIKDYMYDTKQYHIILLAINQIGWHNLVKLQSEASRLCTFNGRFLCDNTLLRKYSEGIICQSACIGSPMAQLLINNRIEEAEQLILEWKDIFKDRFYLEIQPLNIPEQRLVNLKYMELCKKHNINPVATNDVHWTNYSDYEDHDTLLCIGTNKKKNDTNRMKYSNDFWIKSKEEMISSFNNQLKTINEEYNNQYNNSYIDFYMEALNNTNVIANRIDNNIKLGSDKPLFSDVKVPHNLTPEQYLRLLAWNGLYKYLSNNKELNTRIYEKRLAFELDIIINKGFAPYIIAVYEYTNWAKTHDCPIGPGRGSAAGSLVLFSIGITNNIDPIKYNLLFSRFLTKDRTAPPDIDIDFDYNNRDNVIIHLEEYYGKEKVAHIGTYTTMGVKSGLKDVGRVLDMPFDLVNNQICKKIDEINIDKTTPTFKDYDSLKDGNDNEQKQWIEFNKLEKQNKELFRLARAFEGIPRNFGVHASGILVTPCDVNDYVPTRLDKNTGVTITLYTGPQLEEYNFIKYDILGLKTISIIQDTLKLINEELSIENLYDCVDITDSQLYEYISDKNTDAMFQIESNLMKKIIDEIKPTEFNDIVAINAIARPGPISVGMDKEYANVKNGIENIKFPLKGIDNILKETYGTILYQEQLMAISKQVSGFNDGQADSITRRIIAKKKIKLFPMLIRCHIYGKKNCEGPEGWESNDNAPWYDPKGTYGDEIKGALANGYSVEEMKQYFDYIMGFANYCFNKSHAATYSYISIMTAWLKKYYPVQFMSAVLSMSNEDKRKKYMSICEQSMNIKISTPDINLSQKSFTPNQNNILYGISSVKGVGESSLIDIIQNRPYKNLEDALNKIPKKSFNKRVAINLIKSGAFDFEDSNRYNLINKFYDLRKEKDERYDPNSYNEFVCMQFEHDTLGYSITYKSWWDNICLEEKVSNEATLLSTKEIVDKKGRLMAFIELEINNCKINATVYSNKYSRYVSCFDTNLTKKIYVEGQKQNGKKDGETILIINKAKRIAA